MIFSYIIFFLLAIGVPTAAYDDDDGDADDEDYDMGAIARSRRKE